MEAGRPVIKALRLRDRSDLDVVAGFPTSLFLIDAHVTGMFGGTGVKVDLDLARAFRDRFPPVASHPRRRPPSRQRGRGDPCGATVRRRRQQRRRALARPEGSRFDEGFHRRCTRRLKPKMRALLRAFGNLLSLLQVVLRNFFLPIFRNSARHSGPCLSQARDNLRKGYSGDNLHSLSFSSCHS